MHDVTRVHRGPFETYTLYFELSPKLTARSNGSSSKYCPRHDAYSVPMGHAGFRLTLEIVPYNLLDRLTLSSPLRTVAR